MDIEMKPFPLAPVAPASTSNRLQYVIIMVGLVNALVMSLLVVQLWQMNSQANTLLTTWHQHEPTLTRLMAVADGMSTAVSRAIHGKVAHIASNAMRTDFAGVADLIRKLAADVYHAYEGQRDSDLDWVAQYSSLVESIAHRATQVGPIFNATESHLQKPVQAVKQFTGEGGLALEVLNYLSDYVQNQTKSGDWKIAGGDCVRLANRLMKVRWEGSYHCPANNQEWCSWNIDQGFQNALQQAHKICLAAASLPATSK